MDCSWLLVCGLVLGPLTKSLAWFRCLAGSAVRLLVFALLRKFAKAVAKEAVFLIFRHPWGLAFPEQWA